MGTKFFTMDELCELTGYSKRTIRYYIQLGLVSKPRGETKAAKYYKEHISQLLKIKELTAAGISLERIKDILAGSSPPVAISHNVMMYRPAPGKVEVRSHIYLGPGIEVQIAPEEAGFSPQDLRFFIREVLKLIEGIQKNSRDQN